MTDILDNAKKIRKILIYILPIAIFSIVRGVHSCGCVDWGSGGQMCIFMCMLRYMAWWGGAEICKCT